MSAVRFLPWASSYPSQTTTLVFPPESELLSPPPQPASATAASVAAAASQTDWRLIIMLTPSMTRTWSGGRSRGRSSRDPSSLVGADVDAGALHPGLSVHVARA